MDWATLGSFTAGACCRAGHGGGWWYGGGAPRPAAIAECAAVRPRPRVRDDHVRGLQRFRGRLITAHRDPCGADPGRPGGRGRGRRPDCRGHHRDNRQSEGGGPFPDDRTVVRGSGKQCRRLATAAYDQAGRRCHLLGQGPSPAARWTGWSGSGTWLTGPPARPARQMARLRRGGGRRAPPFRFGGDLPFAVALHFQAVQPRQQDRGGQRAARKATGRPETSGSAMPRAAAWRYSGSRCFLASADYSPRVAMRTGWTGYTFGAGGLPARARHAPASVGRPGSWPAGLRVRDGGGVLRVPAHRAGEVRCCAGRQVAGAARRCRGRFLAHI